MGAPSENDHKHLGQYISEELNNENRKAVIKIYELVFTKYSHNKPTSKHSLLRYDGLESWQTSKSQNRRFF
jgi:hypothetical protein